MDNKQIAKRLLKLAKALSAGRALYRGTTKERYRTKLTIPVSVLVKADEYRDSETSEIAYEYKFEYDKPALEQAIGKQIQIWARKNIDSDIKKETFGQVVVGFPSGFVTQERFI